MCQSMVDIQCAAAEIMQGKRQIEDRKKLHGLPYSIRRS